MEAPNSSWLRCRSVPLPRRRTLSSGSDRRRGDNSAESIVDRFRQGSQWHQARRAATRAGQVCGACVQVVPVAEWRRIRRQVDPAGALGQAHPARCCRQIRALGTRRAAPSPGFRVGAQFRSGQCGIQAFPSLIHRLALAHPPFCQSAARQPAGETSQRSIVASCRNRAAVSSAR